MYPKNGDAYAQRDEDPIPLDHVRDTSTRMRNPASRCLKFTVQEVHAAMYVRNEGAE